MSIHQPAAGPATGRRTHHPKKVTASVLAGAMLVVALAPLAAAPANAALSGVGPVSTEHGFPEWYDDGDVKLALCYVDGCLETLPDPTAAPVQPNFPGEAFWFAAGATVGDIGSYEAALEAAHANEEAIDGDQIGFARLRFRFNGLQPNTAYTITHPYGVDVLTTDALGGINVTEDAGECQPGDACNWAGVGNAFLGDAAGQSAKFLTQVGAPAGTLGSIETARRVTGSVLNTNFVSVVGPEGEVGRTELFTVQGLIANVDTGAPSTPNLADASDSGSSNTDGITSDTTPTLNGTAPAGATTVEVLIDGASVGTATVAAGAYSFTTAMLADGQHTVQAQVATTTDPDGLATSGTMRVTVDTAAPTTTIVSPFPSSPGADTTPTFNFSSNEPTATFECALTPSNAIFTACTSPKTWDQQLSGSHRFDVRATDRAGNLGAAATRTIQIGTTATPPPPAGTAEQKDMNGDGNPDIVARDSSGRLYLYPSTATGGFGARVLIGTGWGSMNAILQPGDFNGDRHSDIMARDTSGRLWLYAGTGTGRITNGVQIGQGWQGMTALVTPGNFNGTGGVDLLARDGAGRLFLYPGNGNGTWGTRTQPGSGWNGMTAIVGTGDFSGDARADLFARDASGRLYLYRGNGTGGFLSRLVYGTGWNAMTGLTAPGAFGSGATRDLIARDTAGVLWLYNGNGAGG
ncbi:FG-GAP-like repeat-containing protein, partial [Arthrobacter parietis]